MTYPIIDLHCDLLSYLAGSDQRTPYDEAARCSIPQLQIGNVKLQTLAVFAETKQDSVKSGMAQLDIFQKLPLLYEDILVHSNSSNLDLDSNKIAIAFALENASTFCDENESISEGLKRLKNIVETVAKPLYISLTWNGENRFGGGTHSTPGLKEDGKRLLQELNGQKIALDLSHASDALAHDVFLYIDGEKLNIPVLASHSNARAITNVPRNLPDEIAKEIFKRKGIIGLNFYRLFVGAHATDFARHLQHWIQLGGEGQICLGADLFYKGDLAGLAHPQEPEEPYFPDYEDATHYGKLLSLIQHRIDLRPDQVEGIAYQNALAFIKEQELLGSIKYSG